MFTSVQVVNIFVHTAAQETLHPGFLGVVVSGTYAVTTTLAKRTHTSVTAEVL
jgi:hypothetical protein